MRISGYERRSALLGDMGLRSGTQLILNVLLYEYDSCLRRRELNAATEFHYFRVLHENMTRR